MNAESQTWHHIQRIALILHPTWNCYHHCHYFRRVSFLPSSPPLPRKSHIKYFQVPAMFRHPWSGQLQHVHRELLCKTAPHSTSSESWRGWVQMTKKIHTSRSVLASIRQVCTISTLYPFLRAQAAPRLPQELVSLLSCFTTVPAHTRSSFPLARTFPTHKQRYPKPRPTFPYGPSTVENIRVRGHRPIRRKRPMYSGLELAVN